MAKKEQILIITIKDGVVNEAKLFSNVKKAEEAFIIKAVDLGAKPRDLDSHLDDGYYQMTTANKSWWNTYQARRLSFVAPSLRTIPSNETVCLVHPEVL